MLGSLMILLKGMRRMMFQLSGFYYRVLELRGLGCKAEAWFTNSLKLREVDILNRNPAYTNP